MLNKFSLYDFIAVIIPGIFFLWAIKAFVNIPILQQHIPLSGGITDTSVLIVVGYVSGLLLQGVSQHITERILLWWWGGFPSARWLLPEDKRFTYKYKQELSAVLQNKFDIDLNLNTTEQESKNETLNRNQEIFYRCYRSIEKTSDLPQIFNAQYGLFRSLLTTFILLMLLSGWKMIDSCFQIEAILLFILFFFGTVISYWRVVKRADDFAKSVYDVFISHFGK